MALGKKLRKTAFTDVSVASLRGYAVHSGIRDAANLPKRALVEKLTKQRRDHQLTGYLSQFPMSDLRAIAKAWEIDLRGKRSKLAVRLALNDFIQSHSADAKARRRKKAQLGPSSFSKQDLVALGEEAAQEVVHLTPKKRGPIAGVWTEPNISVDHEGLGSYLHVDLRVHPTLQREGILEVLVDVYEWKVECRVYDGGLPRATGNAVALYAHPARDVPSLGLLFVKYGRTRLRKWLSENGWPPGTPYNGNFLDRELAKHYFDHWRASHPLMTKRAHAQLGGWPLSWPSQGLSESSPDQRMVLRTYGQAPFVEVFAPRNKFQARLRSMG